MKYKSTSEKIGQRSSTKKPANAGKIEITSGN